MTVVFWFDILSTPIIIIWPQYLPKIYKLIWVTDTVWILNIFVCFVTINLNIESKEPLDVALNYAKTHFILDIVATLPPILTNHNKDV